MSIQDDSFHITEFGRADLPRLVGLLRAVQALHVAARPDVFHDRASDAELLDHMAGAAARGALFLAAVGPAGAVLGYAMVAIETRPADAFRHAASWGYLDTISVAAPARRRGVAGGLIAAMEDRLRARGIHHWRASYWAFNSGSAALLARAGGDPALSVVERRL